MKLFVELDENREYIVNISTVVSGFPSVEVEFKERIFNFDKMQGYKVQFVHDRYELIFDQARYDSYIEAIKKEQALKEAKELRYSLVEEQILKQASDTEAYVMRYLYDEWQPDTEYKVNDRKLFGDNLYKCKQAHTSQAEHTPDLVPSLWDVINDDPTKGTKENPIVIPEPFSSMVYKKGCYYLENDKLYLMNRVGMERSDEIALSYKPSELVGHYFEEVKINASSESVTFVQEFKQPTGSHDTYKKGNKVIFEGKEYESLIDNNVYSPTAYPSGWKEIIKQ